MYKGCKEKTDVDEQTSCFHLEVFPSPGDLLKHEAHIPHMSHVQRPGTRKNYIFRKSVAESVVRDLKSGGRRFKSRSDQLELFLGRP